mgnify:CR=1 FL=1
MPFPLELKYIEIAEDQFGLKFPEKYKSKMQQENSGEFRVTFSETTNDDEIEPWWLFPFQDSSEIKRIKRTMNHLVHENQSIQDMRISLQTVLLLLLTTVVTIYCYAQ